jgi:hypothetical protein
MSDCKLGSDNLHFDATGEVDAAQKMFSKLQELGLLDDEDPTGITSPVPSKGGAKQSLDEVNGREECYDLSGRKVVKGKQPGFYIQNNRKVLVQ